MDPIPLPPDLEEQVQRALAEDIGAGDVTANLVPADARVHARVVTREAAVLCGTAWFDAVFRALDPAVRIGWERADGDRIAADDVLCTVEGRARPILSGERSALNFLQLLSGTATEARRFADAVAGTRCTVLDTRKTLPGLRTAQKYAVRVGGCGNHRMGLYDMVLVKENHIAAAGGIAAAVQKARETAPDLRLEVEVESLAELEEALGAGADIVMLDDFSLADMKDAVRRTAGKAKLEASGSVDLARLREIAATGVDYVSVGALTKHVRAIDLSMRFD
jgi:nicotinate-nucleotide pyrophosphorylase (carboxylating)